MTSDRIKSTMLANAKEITRLQTRVNETVSRRDAGERELKLWEEACFQFHARYDALAFPSGYGLALERIADNEKSALEEAICFLECRPYFFRSGYMYQQILRKIKHAKLSEAQAARLCLIVGKRAAWNASKRAAHDA